MAETQADILRQAAGFYPIQIAVAEAMVAGADALEEVADLRRRLEQAEVFVRWVAAQPCQCEDVALPVTGGPRCAACDANAFLDEGAALDLAAPATPEVALDLDHKE